MTLKNLDKAPFPWFGGKRHAAPAIWAALGDVDHYVEPFAGSLAVLLCRPHTANRAYHSETVNDADGLLVNFWRALAQDPDAVADAASWPVSEADLMARHMALVRWKSSDEAERLLADPERCDLKLAGWWVWGQSSWIGSGWCSGEGPWIATPEGPVQQGRKGHRREPGVSRQRPHLTNGKGVNHAGAREPGVNRPQAREPGVTRIVEGLRSVVDGLEPEPEFHPMTMPELRRWLQFLAARLRHVRILHGDWTRAVTSGALKTINVRQGKGAAGIFLDPPYLVDVRAGVLYAHDDHRIAHDVREWCKANGDDYRIVLAGFTGEHEELEAHGWSAVQWYQGGLFRGGMGNVGTGGQQHRERLWLSPHCECPDSVGSSLGASRIEQKELFSDVTP